MIFITPTSMILFLLLFVLALPLLVLVLVGLALRLRRVVPHTVGFFHPFTNDGGGGERVLWCAVRAIQETAPKALCFVYTGDDASSESLASRASGRFGVQLLRPVEVVRLYNRHLIEASSYPHFTLLGQSLGSIWLALEALWRRRCQLFVDTAGYAFTYPVARLMAGCHVAAYTHYPTISTDMLRRVRGRESLYNNAGGIAKSAVLSHAKVLYYQAFAVLYGLAGGAADVIMVNSSWTEGHVRSLFVHVSARSLLLRLLGFDFATITGSVGGRGGGAGGALSIHRVYPPCNTAALQALPLERPDDTPGSIISVAQFRPEKNHALQLRAFARALKLAAEDESKQEEGSKIIGGSEGDERGSQFRCMDGVRLKLVGSARHGEDEERIELLGALAAQLGIESRVDFCINVPYQELISLLGSSTCGIHTMLDEHFGIGIVEYMAAGAITLAHNSGGPKQDILVEENDGPVGFLATSEEEYAHAIKKIFSMSHDEQIAMARKARERASRFSEEKFYRTFNEAILPLVSTIS